MTEYIHPEFQEFPKIARFNREIIVTEKLDGTNAQIHIDEFGRIAVGSRTRWITSTQDNYGFAKWVEQNSAMLSKLGPGRHFGEWWGAGIQRRYGMQQKQFSLFNVQRWVMYGDTPQIIQQPNPTIIKMQEVLPEGVGLVPILYRGEFDKEAIYQCLQELRTHGSKAAPGYMNPEGVVVFHTAGNVGFKITLEHDELPKSLVVKSQ